MKTSKCNIIQIMPSCMHRQISCYQLVWSTWNHFSIHIAIQHFNYALSKSALEWFRLEWHQRSHGSALTNLSAMSCFSGSFFLKSPHLFISRWELGHCIENVQKYTSTPKTWSVPKRRVRKERILRGLCCLRHMRRRKATGGSRVCACTLS